MKQPKRRVKTQLTLLRAGSGLTAQDVADKVGIHLNTYRTRERDMERLSDAERKALAELFAPLLKRAFEDIYAELGGIVVPATKEAREVVGV